MIIKGGSRAGPSQLAQHLGRTDTNERVEVLELHSPTGSMREAFRDWQVLAGGTKGSKGLYHANIDPDAKYPMTPDQWARAVEVLEEELGLRGQPRAVVLHDKNGREHIHVVWQRTDIDSMTLRSDSYNFVAHERASLRLEQEFGHEIVPGKHAKRNRETQPDMPDARLDHHEWQQGESAALDHKERKEQVTALFEASDNGPAFKAALEDAGYVLARGDSRDFVIVDAGGKVHSLGRQLPGVRSGDLSGFMAGVDRTALPDVPEAKARQRDTSSAIERKDASGREALLDAIAVHHATERDEQNQRQGTEVTALQNAQQDEASRVLDALAKDWTSRELQERHREPGAWQRLWRELREAVSEDARQQRLAAEARALMHRDERYQQAARNVVAGLEVKHRTELKDLIDRQAREQSDLHRAQDEDRARRLGDYQRAHDLQREYEQRQQDALSRQRDGPEQDGRAR